MSLKRLQNATTIFSIFPDTHYPLCFQAFPDADFLRFPLYRQPVRRQFRVLFGARVAMMRCGYVFLRIPLMRIQARA